MKSIYIALALLIGCVSTSVMAKPAPKVEVCHIPPGNPDNYHTIVVSENALRAHLAHGDIAGACDPICEEICDDGDYCTIDFEGDCELNGCFDVPLPIDCDDGDLCTVDSCNSSRGCENTPVACIAPDLCTNSTCSANTGQCEETPIVCPDNYSCDLATGNCELDTQFECQVDADCDLGFTCIQNECVEGAARDLRGPDSGSCDGPAVGFTTVVLLEQDAGLRVDVEFENGPPSSSLTIYWVCTNVGGGCHGDACGYEVLGSINTDASGQGSFSTVLPNGNPYPDKYVHFDLLGGGNYTSVTHDEIFPVVPSTAPTATLSSERAGGIGDPTDK